MGQNPVPPVNMPIFTKIGSKMDGAPIPKWDPIGFEPWPNMRSEAHEFELVVVQMLRAVVVEAPEGVPDLAGQQPT